MAKSTKKTFSNQLKPGKLFRNRHSVYVYTVPETVELEAEPDKSVRIELSEGTILLALSCVECEILTKIKELRANRYQLFALLNEEIVSFTYVGSNDGMVNSLFEICEGT